jgi:predicted PurR-regulated permease PerM
LAMVANRLTRISYAFILLTILFVGWLHLATPFITVLFAYFALSKLDLGRSRWFAVGLFLLLVLGIFYGFVLFAKNAWYAFPKIADTAIRSILDFAQQNNIELPFTDRESLKALVLETVKDELRYVGNFAKLASKQFLFVVIGLVVAVSVFLNSRLDLGREKHVLKNNLYSLATDEIIERFKSFYNSFETVVGAQLIISAINTSLTTIFILLAGLPHAAIVVVLTFLCGLLPIIGNIISNTIIVGIAFTVSPRMALLALVFLVVVHKLEYFLNSKIIGDRIKNPVWLTLLGLILGERLMGVPGMILAPVVLYYLKMEMAKIEVPPRDRLPPPEEALIDKPEETVKIS